MVRAPLSPPRFRYKQRRGATIAEFAIVASVFFLIVLGLVELGRGFMVLHLLNNAAREGCRVACLEGKSSDDVSTAVNALLASQGVSGAQSAVQVDYANADAATAQRGDVITVAVSVPVTQVTWLPGGQFLSGTLGGTCTIRRE